MKVGIALAVVVVVSTTQMITVHPAHAWEYGALAASCNHWFGVGFSNVSENEAQSEALGYCLQVGGADCKPVVTISKGCMAFAVSGSDCGNYPTGMGYGANRSAAQTKALKICNSGYSLPAPCRILADVCPGTDRQGRASP
jgi:hypothetical protein